MRNMTKSPDLQTPLIPNQLSIHDVGEHRSPTPQDPKDPLPLSLCQVLQDPLRGPLRGSCPVLLGGQEREKHQAGGLWLIGVNYKKQLYGILWYIIRD